MNRAQTTHRITRGTDSTVTCYARNDAGPMDTAAATLTATLRDYRTGCIKASYTATQASTGKLTFTVPDNDMQRGLRGDLYRFAIDADGVSVYESMLEIV